MTADELLTQARSLLHVQEQPRGSNRGLEIDAWANRAGVPLGSPWCALFVCWGAVEKWKTPAGWPSGFVPSASALRLWEKNQHLWVPHGEFPQPGDVFVMEHQKGRGHTGFVDSLLSTSAFRDISGNSDDQGSREGWEVCQNDRRYGDPRLLGYIRVWTTS